ncbi:SusE domain-containing protein [Algivirga pacifica]|uniref:SusE outer membrane protein domain-containing protein n=1 Tax=Algivirga pacifica TaxID=1162670 RepID=A0ABP9D6Z6_9BACT
MMNKLYNCSVAIVLGLLATMTACTEQVVKPQVLAEEDRVAPAMTIEEGISIVLGEENIGESMLFTWNPENIGVDVPVSYRLEAAPAGTDFADAKEWAITNITEAEVAHKDLNNDLQAWGLEVGQAHMIELRVVVSFAQGTNFESLSSEPMTMNITPWADADAYPEQLYLAGSFQGWNNANEHTVLKPIGVGIFEGTYLFHESTTYFKILTKKGSWDSQLGERGTVDGILDHNDGSDPDPLVVEGMGYYTIRVDLLTKVYSISKVENTWSIVGSALTGNDDGWGQDIQMDFTNDGTSLLYTATVDLHAGFVWKFRFNKGWDLNLGDGDTDGVLEINGYGNDITVEESGLYTITLDVTKFAESIYTYTIEKN